MKQGRPSIFTQELSDRICREVASTTLGLNALHEKYDWFPNPDTIFQWRYDHKSFSENYNNAKRNQADLLAEEILEIADMSKKDTYIDATGNERCNTEWIARSRLRIDTRKWIACKLLPKVYGDKGLEEKIDKTNQDVKDLQELVDKCKPTLI